MVVDPELRPPAYEGTVWIDADEPRDVEAPYLDVQTGKGVKEKSVGEGFIYRFFLLSSSVPLR